MTSNGNQTREPAEQTVTVSVHGHPMYALTIPVRLTARYGLTADGAQALSRPSRLTKPQETR